MGHQTQGILFILLALPVIVFGTRMGRWHAACVADVLRRHREGSPQLEDRTVEAWMTALRTSTRALFRYRRLQRAEADGTAGKPVVDERPFAHAAPDPETYAAYVIGGIAAFSGLLAFVVLGATQSLGIAVLFGLGAAALGVLLSRPLLRYGQVSPAQPQSRPGS